MNLKVGTYNLENGGIDDGSESRLLEQLCMLGELDLDLLGLQECKWGVDDLDDEDRLLNLAADRLGMTYRALVHSNHHACHLAILVRERPGLEVAGTHHDQAVPWWHAQAVVKLSVIGRDRPVYFMNIHGAPGSTVIREAEAETFFLYRHRDTISVGDFNAAAVGEIPRVASGADPAQVRRKGNQRAAEAVKEAGFIDVAAVWGDRTPTVGHRDGVAYRADRICTTLPDSTVTGYHVVEEEGEPKSDHRPVVATFSLTSSGSD
ncbi:endonuclease/exonuclease/phosphatase family protein [Spongiactinospora sp. TRM90649]|uniref:endonuclease/exonuclease/phosphatase family protein n=1 Tax=Spongiactinospora sp. TRM90649 TaxID=3031114 RepID=UPI0023F78E92|nr:endonuclease/exonuclease/phosphatase family protein [Spongiactinospora sp. TRM90649]MDF5756573.1 hypothetical protein [Spongiactinospora sp. TRM90649]